MADNLTLKVTLTGDGRQLSGTLQNASGEIREFGAISERGAAQAERGFDNTQRSAKRLGSELGSVNQVGSAVRNTLLGLGGALSVREVVRYTDAWTGAENMLRLVTDSSGELAAMQSRLMEVANQTRSGFEGTANLYSRLARSTTELNLTQEQLVGLTTTINQSFATSGATAQEAEAAIVQLSQGLAAGALRGDEFNSVSEQAPGIMRAIADSLNMTIGELRDFAAEGGITAEIVVDALQGASDAIAQDFAGSMATFGQQMEVARNKLLEWVGTSDEVRGAVGLAGDSIVTLAENMDTLVDVGQVGAALFAGRFAQSLYTTAAAKIAANRAALTLTGSLRAMNGVMMTAFGPLGIAVTAAGVLYTFREELGLTSERAGLTEEQLADLRAEMSEMSGEDLGQSLDSLNDALDEATLRAATAREELAALREESGGSGFLGFDGGVVGERIRGMQAVADATQKIAEVEDKLEVARQERRSRRAGDFKSLDEWLFKLNEVEEQEKDRVETTKSAANATEEQANALEQLRRQLDPAYAAQRKLAESTALLDRGLATGALTLSQYLELWDLAAEAYMEAGRGAEDAADSVDVQTDAMATLWERRLERMDDAAVDMWRSFIDGSEDAFGSFKRLAINTLAEVIHTYTTQRITASLGLDVAGIAGGSSGGVGSLPGGGNLISKGADLLGLTSSLGAAGSAPISYATGFGAQVATGTYTGALGNATAAASTSSSGILSGISAAAPWIAGGLALDSLLDLGIVEGVVDFVSGLFGGGKKDYHFDFVQGEQPGVFGDRESALGQFGIERFSDFKLGEQQDQLNDLMTSIAEFDNALAAVAIPERVDAMRESIEGFTHSGPETLFEERLRAIVDGSGMLMEEALGEIADPQRLAEAVTGVLRLEALGVALGDSLMAGVTEELERYAGTERFEGAVVSMTNAAEAAALLQSSSERLGIQFDDTSDSAIHVASNLQAAAGGVQNLASLHEGYTQAMYSEAERLSWAYDDLTQSLSEHVDAIPRSVEEYRNLVEGLDLSTESGRELYLTLTQLAPAFAESVQGIEQAITGAYQEHLGRAPEIEGFDYWVDRVQSGAVTLNEALEYIANSTEAAAGGMEATRMRIEIMRLEGREAAAVAEERRIELAYMEQSLHPLQQRIWALEDEAAAQAEAERRQQERNRALEQERRAMERAQQQLESFTKRIEDWLAQLNATDKGMGTPQEQFSSAQEDFAAMLVRAESGDRSALQSITQYADRYLSAAQGMYASGDASQSVRDEIIAAMEGLPELLSAEQFLAQEIDASLGEQTDTLAAELQALRDQAEGIVEANAGGSQLLVEILQHEMGLLGETVLTDAQIRAALAPHATDAEIDRLIGRVDANGDGMVSLQEATNARLDSMAGGIASAMSPLFDQIDLDGNELIDYSEFERIFADMATDDELRRIYSRLDMDGDRQISKMEAVRQAASSTASASEDAANNTGVSGALWDAIGSVEWEVRQIALRTINSSNGIRVSWARNHNHDAFADLGYQISREMRAQGIANGGTAYAKGGAFVGGVQAFANGGAFTNSVVSSPTTFPMGLMGEAGPEAIMPLARAPDGRLGIEPVAPPIMPEFPLLGGNDVAQVMRDLRSEVAQLRRELADSQQEIADNTGQTRDAVAGVGRHAAQQREQQLSEQRAANRALRRQKRGQTV